MQTTPAANATNTPLLFRVRTITAGVAMQNLGEAGRVEAALNALLRSKKRFEERGYQVQTIRVVTPSLLANASTDQRKAALGDITRLDSLAAEHGAVLSIGSILGLDHVASDLASWASDMSRATRVTSCSVTVAGQGRASIGSAAAAAAVVSTLARVAPQGVANFRFAAAANIPAGTPFFPVAHHEGSDSLAIGLESPRLLRQAIANRGVEQATQLIKETLDKAFAPVAALAAECARTERRRFLGIDSSPAPGMDSSIGEMIETLTGTPFGGASTLEACAAITAALKQLSVPTCGYSGLMLPVLEDPVLARRAAEHRYGVNELLLFSAVCGTGLDVVPLPGDTPVPVLARIIRDVATMSVRLNKPLSARLFPVPGKAVGEEVAFDDPLLTKSVTLPVA
jgi:uncharacterized protein (UPF0210 family)